MLLTLDGDPAAYVRISSPGDAGPATAHMALCRAAAHFREEEALRERFRERLGGRRPEHPALDVSVVVPTHRRPAMLAGLFDSLAALDPAPFEVIVVDNDPGDADCRRLVEEAGYRYLREDRRGLNIARRSGLAAARGQIVAFTDDDCLVNPRWLAAIPELFADPLVGIVTAPGLPAELATGAQLRREEEAGFDKGLVRARFGWHSTRPPHAGIVGSGNSMAMRRGAAERLEIFPPELDAGTRARSAGDLFAIFRLLAAGYDAVYEPRMFFLHRHPAAPGSLRATIRSYGIGAGAYYAKLLVEEREPAVLRLWAWFVWRWLEAVLDAATGAGDAGRTRVRFEFMAASLLGPSRWRQAIADLDAPGRAVLERSRAAAALPPPAEAPPIRPSGPAGPPVSVVVAHDGAADLGRCLDALGAALGPGSPHEIVVAGAVGGLPGDRRARFIPAAGGIATAWNAGAAAARGDVLLFLHSSQVADVGLVTEHARRHGDEPGGVVVGRSAPVPLDRRLATLAVWRERETDFRLASEAGAPTVADMGDLNVSMRRELFASTGGFELGFGDHPAREWAVRALGAGARLVHAPAAVAFDDVRVTASAYTQIGLVEGRLAGALAQRHPHAACAAVAAGPATELLARARLWQHAALLLEVLEALKLRRSWLALAGAARAGARMQGLREAGASELSRRPTLAIDLESAAPIPAPRLVAPAVELRFKGRAVATAHPPGGHWHHDMLEAARRRARPLGWSAITHVAASLPAAAEPASALRTTVLLGPPCDEAARSERDRLRAAGATVVEVADGPDPVAHWRALDRTIRGCDADVAVLPLPGARLGPGCVAELARALEGTRVALALGAGLAADDPPAPLALYARPRLRNVYPFIGSPSQFIALRRDCYEQVGGIDPWLARFGAHAPVFDLAERCLDAGLVVAHCDSHDVAPAGRHRPARSRGEWRRSQARGALFVRRALERGGLGALHVFVIEGLLSQLVFRRPSTAPDSLRHGLGALAGFVVGAVRALAPGALPPAR